MRYFAVDVSPLIVGYPGEPGAYMNTEEINREAADLISAVHNLDRDNFGEEEILAAHLANKACGQVFYDEINGTTTVLSLTTGLGENTPIVVPNASDEPWYLEVETGDAILIGKVLIEITDLPFVTSVQGEVQVDGVGVAMFPIVALEGASDRSVTMFVPFAAPVPAGLHRIEAVLMLGDGSSAYAIDLGTRAMFVREVLR